MRMTEISVKKLFGVFDYVIPLNMKDRITIIHGPNGVGKTILLKMLKELFSLYHPTLDSIPFAVFQVVFDDDSRILLRKKMNEKKRDDLICQFFEAGGTARQISFPDGLPADSIKKFIPELKQFGEKWKDLISGEIYSSKEEILEHFGDRLSINPRRHLPRHVMPVPVHIIETQRLQKKSRSRGSINSLEKSGMAWTVSEYARELVEIIESELAESARLSQSLDRSFPSRVLKKDPSSLYKEETLRNKLAALEEKRAQLMAAGLLDQEENTDLNLPDKIEENTTNFLSVYVEDAEKKLKVFDNLANKIELFKMIINERFKYKEMIISKDDGFFFRTGQKISLPPCDLSFGEQHELTILYELLFKVKSGSLILIDEPELSLHVAWLVQFLADLQQIIQLASVDVLIATHSPDIIHDRWDLTVELKGPKL